MAKPAKMQNMTTVSTRTVLAQERSRSTHRSLTEVAARLWAEQGFDNVPISEICRTAGVAKGTFYFYFTKKEDLLVELGFSALDPILESTKAALDKDQPAWDVLDDALARIAKTSRAFDKPLLARMVEETLSAAERYFELRGDHAGYREIFQPIIETAQEKGSLPKHYTAENLATMLAWAVLQAVHQWAKGQRKGSLSRALNERAQIVWNGAQVAPR